MIEDKLKDRLDVYTQEEPRQKTNEMENDDFRKILGDVLKEMPEELKAWRTAYPDRLRRLRKHHASATRRITA